MVYVLADEDIPKPVINLLREDFEVVSADEEFKGATDNKVLEQASENDYVIITFDSDFTQVEKNHPGIIYVTSRDKYSKVAESISKVLETVSEKDLRNEVFMVSP